MAQASKSAFFGKGTEFGSRTLQRSDRTGPISLKKQRNKYLIGQKLTNSKRQDSTITNQENQAMN